MTVLAVFRSRTETLDLAYRLRQAGISVGTVNTPREVGVGCGLSVKIDQSALTLVKGLVARANYSSFVGFYRLNSRYGAPIVNRIG